PCPQICGNGENSKKTRGSAQGTNERPVGPTTGRWPNHLRTMYLGASPWPFLGPWPDRDSIPLSVRVHWLGLEPQGANSCQCKRDEKEDAAAASSLLSFIRESRIYKPPRRGGAGDKPVGPSATCAGRVCHPVPWRAYFSDKR